jgi:hypothetical protein
MVKVTKIKPGMWDLNDLAGAKEIGDGYGLSRSLVCNWATRYADFPAPILVLATGAIYSRRQVAEWLSWHPTLGAPR